MSTSARSEQSHTKISSPEFEIFFGLAVVAFDVFIDGETDPAKFHFRLNFCRLLRSIEEMIVLLKLNCSCYWNYKRRKINEKEATNILINAALVSIAKTAKTFEQRGHFIGSAIELVRRLL